MTTKQALAALVQTVNTADLAREAEVSTKTIYRIRHQAANPSLETIQNIQAAVVRLAKAGRKVRATKQPA